MGRRARNEGSVFRRRDGRWAGAIIVGYRNDGKPIKKYVYASTQREVVKKLEDEKRKLAPNTETLEIQTVSQLVRSYSDQFCVGKSHWTVKDHNTIANKLESYYIGHVPLDGLTGDTLAKFFVNLETDRVSSRTRSRIYSLLKRALEYAVHLDLIKKSPLYLINAPSSGELQKPRDAWSAEELLEFIISDARRHRLFPCFHIMFAQGLRVGEALGLRWEDLEGSTLHIRRTVSHDRGELKTKPPKGTKVRKVFLTQEDLAILDQHKNAQEEEFGAAGIASSGWMFAGLKGQVILYDSFRRTFRYLAKVASVRPLRLHGTRRSWRTLNRKAGVDPVLLAHLGGHSPEVAEREYTIVDDLWAAEAVRSLSDIITAQPDNQTWAAAVLPQVKPLLERFWLVVSRDEPDPSEVASLTEQLAAAIADVIAKYALKN